MYRTTDYAKVQKLARWMHDSFEVRQSGENRSEWFLRDGSPEWMRDVIFAGSDDTSFYYAYEFAHEAIEAIANADDEDSIRDAFNELEPDVYTADLTAWLAENVNHVYWLTQVLEDLDIKDGLQALMAAQAEHKRHVAEQVLQALIDYSGEWEDPADNMDPEDFDYDWAEDNNVYPFGS
jgi:hypothetical protein